MCCLQAVEARRPYLRNGWDFDAPANRMAVLVERSSSSSVRLNRGRPLLRRRLRRAVARVRSAFRSWGMA